MSATPRFQNFGACIAIPFIAEAMLMSGKPTDKTPAERARLRASRKRQRLAKRKGRA